MATYNNPHWLLSHIRNSFISTDDTGMCEAVMLSENLPSQYAQYHRTKQTTIDISIAENLKPPDDYYCYPGLDHSDDEDSDTLSQSYDVLMDPDIGLHRQRSNTAQKLEKMDIARRKAAKIKHIKCDDLVVPAIDNNDKQNLFVKKNINNFQLIEKKSSLLTEQLLQCPKQPQNKFIEYARFDGTAQTGIPTRAYNIYLTVLPEELRNYPMSICVTSTAKVFDFIGLICYKCSIANPEIPLESVKNYGLYLAEDNGEVDSDFPPLDINEPCSKFCFKQLAFAERQPYETPPVRFEIRALSLTSEAEAISEAVLHELRQSNSMQQNEDLALMLGHTTMMEAPQYRSYRLQMIAKAVFKTDIQLGISGDKIEIDPVQQKNTKFWSKQKAVSHNMDSIANCEIIDYKQTRSIFRIAYTALNTKQATISTLQAPSSNATTNNDHQSPSAHSSHRFKYYDFETDRNTAQEIVNKINNILEVRSSDSRREYLAYQDNKKNMDYRSGGTSSSSFSKRKFTI